ncbi:MAG: HlyD family efflux transporter periplasmic adaptor subunit [Planctomycetota bacterium]
MLTPKKNWAAFGAAFVLALTLLGCGGAATEQATHAEEDAAMAGKPGLAVPEAVRSNLGITFERVERRAVRQTMRVPGQFELVPTAVRDYHAPAEGRVRLHVAQYDTVSQGDLLATVESPAWRATQASLVEALDEIEHALALVRVAEAKLTEQAERVALWEQRLARLAEANVRDAELEAKLADARLEVPTLRAELDAQRYLVNHAREQAQAHLFKASALTGMTVDELTAPADRDAADDAPPVWQVMEAIEVRAVRDGVVSVLEATDGQWTQAGGHLFETIAPRQLRFRAEALLADLGRLRDGLPATIAPPTGTGLTQGQANDTPAAHGALVIGPVAHAEHRAVSLYLTPDNVPAWARAGAAGYLEINLDPDAEPQLAIPRRAVVRDGLEFVFFRRFPDDPDRVQRVIADTGRHDGKWIEIYSGAREGDEIVIDGVYQLLAASSTTMQKGGHFHADGTYHEAHD